MNQEERINFMISYLMGERMEYADIEIPEYTEGKKRLLRSLMNVRPPMKADSEFIKVQDEYLKELAEEKSITKVKDIPEIQPGIRLWQGDITTLEADAIVNAANSGMIGCFVPCHGCIDNAIHSAAGIQLRLECQEIMERQQHPEPAGMAKITAAYNLPCRHVIHTVGPIVRGKVTEEDRRLLKSCYISCLETAEAHGLKNIAFCCISTGEFHFPNMEAAEIAVMTVTDYRSEHRDGPEVIFNVFKDEDYEIYRRILKD